MKNKYVDDGSSPSVGMPISKFHVKVQYGLMVRVIARADLYTGLKPVEKEDE